jgi:hypothetical protein
MARTTKNGTMTERAAHGLTNDHMVALLRRMMEIRRFEEKAAEMYARGKIHGFLHLYIGQEAVATGAVDALRPDDYIVAHYREHGHAIARGIEPRRIMAELFGKETGVTGGRGGSMHLFDVARSFMGGYAIVAGHMPLACGLALAEQYKGTDRIAVNFLGDGAVNEGEFHEALNLASVWKLPVLFIVENNFYGMGTAVQRVSALVEVYKRAEAYGIPLSRSTGWMCSRCTKPLRGWQRPCAREPGRRSSRRSAIASAVTRCPIRSSTGRRTRSSAGGDSTRSPSFSGGSSVTASSARATSRASRRRSTRWRRTRLPSPKRARLPRARV